MLFIKETIRDAIEDSITWPVRQIIPILPGDYRYAKVHSLFLPKVEKYFFLLPYLWEFKKIENDILTNILPTFKDNAIYKKKSIIEKKNRKK